MSNRIKVYLISLGCSKNQVDSELMLGIISENDKMKIINDVNLADVIIINTCGFIEEAKQESIETIIEAAQLKDKKCRALIVSGCLTQRYQKEIMEEIPEIDAVLGTGTFGNITETIEKVLNGEKVKNIDKPNFEYKADNPRLISEDYTAYVKIAEGCSNNCSYCSIPSIRGPLYSRKIEDIYQEVLGLVEKGVKEVILIAQDTTRYGLDIYGKPRLLDLLKKLMEIKDLVWLRLLYAYPEHIKKEMIDYIAEQDRICNYLDLPIQHSENKIRKLMRREGYKEDIATLINSIRTIIPDITLRTSLIVGFPGETEKDFNNLLQFVKEVKFDRLGVFKYSREEGTAAAEYANQVDKEIKLERYKRIMEIQQKISYNKNERFIDKKIKVIIEEVINGNAYARSQYEAPEVDNQIIIPDCSLNKGDIVLCKIKETYEYDLVGELIKNEFTK